MNRPSPLWLVLIGIVVLLCFTVPFMVFRNVDAWWGSFLFWTVASAIVIGISVLVSSRWRD